MLAVVILLPPSHFHFDVGCLKTKPPYAMLSRASLPFKPILFLQLTLVLAELS